MTPIFDTHAHYDDEAFDTDRNELLTSLAAQGVEKVVNVGASLQSCRQTLSLMEAYDFVYGAIGVHPNETGELNDEELEWLRQSCRHEKCVAIGEIGLDYHWDEPEPAVQKLWFERQLELAREEGLPVIIHSRDAAKDTVDMMHALDAGSIGGVVHCYSYTRETAKTILDMGFYFGIGGVLTFQNAKKLKEAVQYIPMDHIVLETDCPYLAPVPFRGQRNCSAYIPYVVEVMAQLKSLTVEEVRRQAWENSHRLYRLKWD